MNTLNNFEIVEYLSQNSDLTISRAIRKHDNKKVILKFPTHSHPSQKIVAGLKHEHQLMMVLNQPGIIKTLKLVNDESRMVLVLQDFTGVSFSKFLTNNVLTLEDFFFIAIQLTNILSALHAQGIIHKDMKPDVFMINPETLIIKCIDLSLSSMLMDEMQSYVSINKLDVSLSYMAPEQSGRINRKIDQRSDLYSLGVIFYQMLTGLLPFTNQDVLELVHAHLAVVPPKVSESNANIPLMLDQIIAKLLEKMPEQRYYTARGLKEDLFHCAHLLKNPGIHSDFTLGKKDSKDYLYMTKKLYGREDTVKQLLDSFERVNKGCNEVIMVTGYSGIGKTSIVKEIYKPLTYRKGFFIHGKFDQLQQNTPYSAIISAFDYLIKQILAEPESRLNHFRSLIKANLGNLSLLISSFLPSIKYLINTPSEFETASVKDVKSQVSFAFQQLVRVFRQAEHPLVIFLDDLQWADKPSLELLQSLILDPEANYLMLIGAYRDNEVDITHPVTTFLQFINDKKGNVSIIKLKPLTMTHMQYLLADTLSRGLNTVKSLAEVICEKTEGNPFFANEFLKNLYQEKLLRFNYEASMWEWDIDAIKNQAITINVADLLTRNIKLLPEQSQQLLKLGSCIGYRFELDTLLKLSLLDHATCIEAIDKILQVNLIFVESGDFKSARYQNQNITFQFSHDRIQQAADQLITHSEKENIHLALGRLLIHDLTDLNDTSLVMRVADHFNYAKSLLSNNIEKLSVAKATIEAGKNAQHAAAYEAAVNYYNLAKELIGPEGWKNNYSIVFTLHCGLAEALSFLGRYTESDNILQQLSLQAKDKWDKTRVYEIKSKRFRLENKHHESLNQSIACLNMLGYKVPLNPKIHHILFAYLRIRWCMLGRKFSDLDLTKKADPLNGLLLKILGTMYADAVITDNKELLAIIAFYSTRISITHGFANESAYAFISSGFVILQILQKYKEGIEYFHFKEKLEKIYSDHVYEAITLFAYAHFGLHWHRPMRLSIDYFIRIHQISFKMGDKETLSYTKIALISTLFALGDPLHLVKQHNNSALKMFDNRGFFNGFYTLMDRAVFNFTNGEDLNIGNLQASAIEEDIKGRVRLEIAYFYATYVKICYLYGEYELAIEIYEKSLPYAESLLGLIPHVENIFYYCLALSRVSYTAAPSKRKRNIQKISRFISKFKIWAEWAPYNFKSYYLLILAEYSALKDKFMLASEYYEQAAKLSVDNNIYHLSAVINECNAHFFISKNKTQLAAYYLHRVIYFYDQWGALSLSKRIKKLYSNILQEEVNILKYQPTVITDLTIAPLQNDVAFDFMSILKLTKIISGEIQLEKLLQKILKILLENAGAERALLFNKKSEEWFLEAEGNTKEQLIWILQPQTFKNRNDFPKKIISYVQRTGESVIINNTETETQFQDDYITESKTKSLLIIPLFYHGQLNRILYLENKMTSYAFNPQQTQSIGIVGSQAVVSLENAYLYYQATHDSLTGLANRNLLHQLFNHSAARLDSEKKQLGIIFLDLDYFKNINDTFGHEEGDKVLIYFSKQIQSCLNKGDLAVRLGGDEFVILLDCINSLNDVESIITQLYQLLSTPYKITDNEIIISFSAGISLYPKDGKNIHTLLYNADIALYRAKELGKNQYQFFSHELTEKLKKDYQFENDLRNAFKAKQLFLYYQPIYNIKSQKIETLEVLVRWDHPTKGLLDANEFIALLEKTPLFPEIGEWILKSSCEQLKQWQKMGITDIKLAVNVSSLQLRKNQFSQTIKQILNETGLKSEFLELELTESILIEQNNTNALELHALKNLGLSLVIDDFGIGYSSLTYLMWLPISKLKIDQTFIKNCLNDDKSMAIIEMVISLAHRLNISVVAEGIETAEQLQFLAEKQADSIQGFYLSKPLTIIECEKLLQNELQRLSH